MSDSEKRDEIYMRRALQLALNGEGLTSPNPMVGAVITAPDGRIIGQGWHRRFGGPHAEVNAVESVSPADKPLLRQSTIYVTLEPCSHFGKTPPCAALLTRIGFRRVVVACQDPNPKVSGRGLQMLRDAGIEVTTGVCRPEAIELNRRFIIAQTLRRPYIQLKWAQTADGYIASAPDAPRLQISSPLSLVWMHRERGLADAIIIGSDTALSDRPRLTMRHWPGRDKLKTVADRRRRIDLKALFPDGDAIRLPDRPLYEAVQELASEHQIGSIMVEGGARILQSFIRQSLFDEIRIEHSPVSIPDGIAAPEISVPSGWIQRFTSISGGIIIETMLRPCSGTSHKVKN